MINAISIPDAWFQALYEVKNFGRRFKVDSGSFAGEDRIELDFLTILIHHPDHFSGTPEIIPASPEGSNLPPPVLFDYLYGSNGYAFSLLDDAKADNEDYTYGNRLKHPTDQVKRAIEVLKETPRTNQMVLRFSKPEDIFLGDPPCLTSIFCRIQDGELIFHIYFRSNDMYSGFPANMVAIEFLQKTMALEIGVK